MQHKSIQLGTQDGGKTIAYTEWGDSQNPKVVFCVHGLSRNSRDFDILAKTLSKNYRVICIDIIGRGESDWFNDQSLYAYPHYISLCLSFLQKLNIESVDWVGTSMGGLIGMFIASMPDSPIKSLVLNDIGSFIPKQALRRIGQYIGKAPDFNSDFEAEVYLREICKSFGPLTDPQWRHLVQYGFKQDDSGQYQFKYDPAVGEAFQGDIEDVDLFAIWQLLQELPVLLIRGIESDILLKETAIEMSEGDHCQLSEFSGVGHAPMSGHFATLLRGTVREFLPDHEVYITDWRNARDVAVSEGTLSFDDYVEYLMDFMYQLGPDTHVVAVCQSCVPLLVSLAVMYMGKNTNAPKSVTLMGGPVDVRISPTEVNDYASGKDLEWFENNVICTVPKDFAGQGQLVYPGFIQLSGFMSMNLDSHISKHFKFFDDLVKGDGDSAEAHRKFYNEYLAVMDMSADYYIDTIREVFLEHKLPKGTMEYRGQRIDLGAITNTALLTIEGEMDDITGTGQTSAALSLCKNIPNKMEEHYEQKGVGHYGIT